MNRGLFLLFLSFLIRPAGAQTPPEAPIYTIGRGVTMPVVIKKIEPSYSSAGRDAGIQGSVLLGVVIEQDGTVSRITTISPLGYGLDEEAAKTVAKWKFRPATLNGAPVRVEATIAVSYHLVPLPFDNKQENRRTRFNGALYTLSRVGAPGEAKAVEAVQKLAKEKYAPAMHLYAVLLREGTRVAADPTLELDLLNRSAQANYGPSMYEIGRMYVAGRNMPLDVAKGREMILAAANLGSDGAQYYLGVSHEVGEDGYEKSADSARQYFRLCAASGRAQCQFRLGRLLLLSPRHDSDYVQAIAWLELAQAGTSADIAKNARDLLAPVAASLTPAQRDGVDRLKTQLVAKN